MQRIALSILFLCAFAALTSFQTSDCECGKDEKYPFLQSGETVLQIDPFLIDKVEIQAFIQSWIKKGNDPLNIKELQLNDLRGFDESFAVFENIERVEIQFVSDISGISQFKHLKHLRLMHGTHVRLPDELSKLEKIKSFFVGKINFEGPIPNQFLARLTDLTIHYCSIAEWNLDLSKAKCLHHLWLTGTHNGFIDLSKIDLSNMPCLDELVLDNTFGNLQGHPKNLEIRKLKRCSLNGLK